MTNYLVTVSYDTSVSSKSHTAYSVDITPTGQPVGEIKRPPVTDNILTDRAIVGSWEAALRYVARLVAAPGFQLIETVQQNGQYYYQVARLTFKPSTDPLTSSSVVFRRTPTGEFYGAENA